LGSLGPCRTFFQGRFTESFGFFSAKSWELKISNPGWYFTSLQLDVHFKGFFSKESRVAEDDTGKVVFVVEFLVEQLLKREIFKHRFASSLLPLKNCSPEDG